MPAQGVLTINETDETKTKAPFLWSARMTYAICAFLSMVAHHCMRSAVNFSILCMVANRNNTLVKLSLADYEDRRVCKSMNDNLTETRQPSGDLEWSRNEEVMFQGIFFYGYIITLPIGGLIADRYGGKIPFVYSLATEALLFMLIPVCSRSSFWLGSTIRFCQGFMAGFGNPAMYQLFTIWAHPTERTAVLAFGYSGFNVGNLIVFPLSSNLCKLGWDYVFYVIGSASLLIAISFQFLVYNSIDTHPRLSLQEHEYLKTVQKPKIKNSKIPWLSILKSFPVYVFILTHFFHTFGVSMEAMMLSRFLKEAMYFPLKDIGYLSALIFLGALISKVTTMFVSLKLNGIKLNENRFRKLVHLTTNLCAVLLLTTIIFLTCRQRWAVVCLWILVSVLTDIAFSLAYWPSIMSLAPSYSGFLIGIANCFGTTSAFLIPVVIAKVAPQGTPTEWQHVISIAAVVYVIDALTFGIFGSSVLQPWGLKKQEDDDTPNQALSTKNATNSK